VLQLPNGQSQRLKVRSMVGLLPLCAVTVFDGRFLKEFPEIVARLKSFLEARPELRTFVHDPSKAGQAGRRLGAILDENKLRRVLSRMLDEKEFLSPYGIRSLSRYHEEHPYVFNAGGQEYRVGYVPGDSDSGMFGGNSNWRGPIWMPMQLMLIRGLVNQFAHLGADFKVECPVGSGRKLNLLEVSQEIAQRLSGLFIRNNEGGRPAHGHHGRWNDEHWRDHILFYEYFHGDTGAGIG